MMILAIVIEVVGKAAMLILAQQNDAFGNDDAGGCSGDGDKKAKPSLR